MRARTHAGAIDIWNITPHRNGICGAPFNLVRFSWHDGERLRPRMMAVVFDAPSHTAVIDQDEPQACWRGDHFESDLRPVVRAFDERADYVPFEEWARLR